MHSKTKRILAILGIYALAFAVLISGYMLVQLTKKPKEITIAPVSGTYVDLVGDVKSFEVALKDVSPYFLATDDGQIYYLNGNYADIKVYLGKKALVSGYYTENENNRKVLDITFIQDPPATELKDVPTTPTLVEYKSANLGISFKYRSDFQIDDKGRILKLSRVVDVEKKLSETISFEIITPGKPIDEYIKKLPADQILQSKIGLDSTKAYKRTKPSGGIEFYIERESKMIYIIIYTPAENSFASEGKNLFYDLMANLRFIPFDAGNALK